MAERTRGYAHRIEVHAPPEMLWQGLVDPLKLRLWFGPEARVAAREGGSYHVRAASDLDREAHIDVFEPGRRLRLIYMPPRSLPGNDAVLVDDFVITREGPLAVLHVLGSGFPVEEEWDMYYNRLRTGWPRALGRLKVLTERESRALMNLGTPQGKGEGEGKDKRSGKDRSEAASESPPAPEALDAPAKPSTPAGGTSNGIGGNWID
jgi:uncharacterized protein YndB with AHSA1/START domain